MRVAVEHSTKTQPTQGPAMLRRCGSPDPIPTCKDSSNAEGTLYFTNGLSSGGGNTANLELNGFGPPLRWMLYEAMDSGLHVKPFKIGEWKSAEHNPSMTWVWKVLECLPLTRLTYETDTKEKDGQL